MDHRARHGMAGSIFIFSVLLPLDLTERRMDYLDSGHPCTQQTYSVCGSQWYTISNPFLVHLSWYLCLSLLGLACGVWWTISFVKCGGHAEKPTQREEILTESKDCGICSFELWNLQCNAVILALQGVKNSEALFHNEPYSGLMRATLVFNVPFTFHILCFSFFTSAISPVNIYDWFDFFREVSLFSLLAWNCIHGTPIHKLSISNSNCSKIREAPKTGDLFWLPVLKRFWIRDAQLVKSMLTFQNLNMSAISISEGVLPCLPWVSSPPVVILNATLTSTSNLGGTQ